jgi:hypothetical protein
MGGGVLSTWSGWRNQEKSLRICGPPPIYKPGTSTHIFRASSVRHLARYFNFKPAGAYSDHGALKTQYNLYPIHVDAITPHGSDLMFAVVPALLAIMELNFSPPPRTRNTYVF